uniref:DUF1799 domain-containing protein n=1 Tax=Roseovarius sp. BRH_c41 TaxID=1629709 RepID=UPI00345BF9D0
MKWAGRAWARGDLIADDQGSDHDDEAAFWGIDPGQLTRDPSGSGTGTGIWPQNVPVVRAFLAVCNQWRTVSAGLAGFRVVGLDYTAARAGLRMSGIRITPQLWAEVQVIESAAVAAMRES